MKVGIIGSEASVNRHVYALRKIQDVRIVGRWPSGNGQINTDASEKIPGYADPDQLLNDSDGIVITDGGSNNHKLTIKALKQAKHVFIYPLMVCSINEALHFVKLAHEAKAVLKVGNIGNISLQGLAGMIPDISGIKLIELHYYKSIEKSPSINQIHEALLINSQIIHSLVKSHILSIKAKGLIMHSSKPEVINARLDYNNGCAVNITCNLIAAKDNFEATIVMSDSCIKYDFISHKLTSWKIQRKKNNGESPLFIDNVEIKNREPLFDDLTGFIMAPLTESKHQIDNDYGFEPFILTERILEKVRKSVIQYN